ncbi:MAG: lytic transglycosylase domain-containing protein, partial [Flavobacteriaceae bacterium]|nr:lytic transglycosylase domain-containing protein [Flavobacteriaceae bacterium]
MNTVSKYLLFTFLFGLSFFLIQAVQEAPTDAIVERKMINDYNIYAIPIPEKLDFAGEPMPLNNPDIKERM